MTRFLNFDKFKITIYLVALFCFNQAIISQEYGLLGQTFYGNDGDDLGSWVSINDTGNRIAYSVRPFQGRVQAFDLINGLWEPIGQELIYEELGDQFGRSFEFNDQGNILVISASEFEGNNGFNSGRVQVFELIDNIWIQMGSDIIGDGNNAGWSVDINGAGNRIVLSYRADNFTVENSGTVRVFDFVNEDWVQVGNDMHGKVMNDEFFGDKVVLSDDGNTVAARSRNVENPADQKGAVYVFELSDTEDEWVAKGQFFEGEFQSDFLGSGLALNDDGSTLAIGAPGVDLNGFNEPGQLKAYSYNITLDLWEQIGDEFIGDSNVDFTGSSVNFNNEGNVLIFSSPFFPNLGPGEVRLFENINNQWIQLGETIIGETEDTNLSIVALNGEGNTFIVGAPGSDDNGVNSETGSVRVFTDNLLSTQEFLDNMSIAVYPNPTSNNITFESESAALNTISFYDITGKEIQDVTGLDSLTATIDISQFARGIYLVQINGLNTLKLVKE
ncbi:hypothetical protein SCB49_07462 [unidentified eubacterium SCB49]|nr:hypothetical protein SCB49_07462 [unidentified eubacterium SCB49]